MKTFLIFFILFASTFLILFILVGESNFALEILTAFVLSVYGLFEILKSENKMNIKVYDSYDHAKSIESLPCKEIDLLKETVVPVCFDNNFIIQDKIGQHLMEKGWYCAKFLADDIEYIPPNSTSYDSYEDCKAACDKINEKLNFVK